jgi:hypothetical protein
MYSITYHMYDDDPANAPYSVAARQATKVLLPVHVCRLPSAHFQVRPNRTKIDFSNFTKLLSPLREAEMRALINCENWQDCHVDYLRRETLCEFNIEY